MKLKKFYIKKNKKAENFPSFYFGLQKLIWQTFIIGF